MSQATDIMPAEARQWVASLPEEFREKAARCLQGSWHDGFFTGAGKLPALNPFASLYPPPAESQPAAYVLRRKTRKR